MVDTSAFARWAANFQARAIFQICGTECAWQCTNAIACRSIQCIRSGGSSSAFCSLPHKQLPCRRDGTQSCSCLVQPDQCIVFYLRNMYIQYAQQRHGLRLHTDGSLRMGQQFLTLFRRTRPRIPQLMLNWLPSRKRGSSTRLSQAVTLAAPWARALPQRDWPHFYQVHLRQGWIAYRRLP